MARKVEKVSIFTIATELGISPSSVSRVINNRTGVSEETRHAVNVLLNRYHFRKKYPEMHIKRIAIVLSVINGVNEYSSLVLTGIYESLLKRGMTACTIPLRDDIPQKVSILSQIREQQCSAAILLPSRYSKEDLLELGNSGLPITSIDYDADIPELGIVNNDSVSGARELTEHLLSLGHRKIGFITRWSEDNNHRERLQGCQQAMQEANLPAENLTVIDGDFYDLSFPSGESGAELFRKMRKTHLDITAIIGINDYIALGILHAAHEMKLRVPEDISIAGFDDIAFCKYTQPPLTTVFHPCIEAGQRAVEQVVNALNHHDYKPCKEILSTHLVIRRSTGPAPKIPGK